MSVIGRLDDQVDNVLIAPLDKNRRPQTAEREAAHDERTSSSRPGQSKPDENESYQDERAATEELPVWLL